MKNAFRKKEKRPSASGTRQGPCAALRWPLPGLRCHSPFSSHFARYFLRTTHRKYPTNALYLLYSTIHAPRFLLNALLLFVTSILFSSRLSYLPYAHLFFLTHLLCRTARIIPYSMPGLMSPPPTYQTYLVHYNTKFVYLYVYQVHCTASLDAPAIRANRS